MKSLMNQAEIREIGLIAILIMHSRKHVLMQQVTRFEIVSISFDDKIRPHRLYNANRGACLIPEISLRCNQMFQRRYASDQLHLHVALASPLTRVSYFTEHFTILSILRQHFYHRKI